MSNTRDAPIYALVKIDTSQVGELAPGSLTGQQTVYGDFDYIVFASALNAGGGQNPGATVTVIPGRGNQDGVPLGLNGSITGKVTQYTIQWTVAAGTVTLVASNIEAGHPGLTVTAPPTQQLVTSSVGSQLNGSQLTVGLAAVQLAAILSTRQSLIIQADSLNTDNIYIGGTSGVTVGASIAKLTPGQSMTIDKTTAAVWGISGSAAQVVRVTIEQ